VETSFVFLGPKMSEKMSCNSDYFIVKFSKKYRLNERFVTNLEPNFKIEHIRVKEHKKRHDRKKTLKNSSNPSARCVF